MSGDDNPHYPDQEDENSPYIIRTQLDPDPETVEFDLLEVIAELEGVEIEELPSFYNQIDHFVEQLFRNPPAPEAQTQIEFSYAGYRITLNQRGEVTLLDVTKSLDTD